MRSKDSPSYRPTHMRIRGPSLSAVTRIALFTAVALMAALPLLQPRTAAAAERPDATISEIVNDPSAYLGQTVTVAGDVEQVFGPRAFSIDDNDLLTIGKMLVVTSQPLIGRDGDPIGIDPLLERTVWVRGEIRSFDIGVFEREADLDLSDNRFDDWEGKPAIMATSVMQAPLIVDPMATSWVTVDEVTDNPNAYIGQTITVSGGLEDVYGPRSFSIEDSDLLFDEQMLVVSSQPLMNRGGQPIDLRAYGDRSFMVTGTVHQFNEAAFEDRLGIDLDGSELASWGGRPALIATSIVPWASIRAPVGAPIPGVVGRPGTTLDQILDSPGAYYEQRVRVSGEVEEVIGPRSFTIADNDLLFDEQMLVVTRRPMLDDRGQPASAMVDSSDVLWITGTVHQFNLAAFEDQLGIDLEDARFADWAGRPALIAESIVQWPPLTVAPGTSGQQNVTVDDLTDNASAYYGRTVTVTGEVADTLGGRSLVLEDNDLLFDEQVLVVSARPMIDRVGRQLDSSMLSGRALSVHGTVRSFDLDEVEREIGIDLDDSSFAGWEGRPVIVADAAYLLPR